MVESGSWPSGPALANARSPLQAASTQRRTHFLGLHLSAETSAIRVSLSDMAMCVRAEGRLGRKG